MEEKLELRDDKIICINKKIKDVFQELYDHYRAIIRRNEYLEEENKRIKDEKYQNEELANMKAQYDKMKKDYYRGFAISEEEEKRISEWQDKVINERGELKATIGGRFKYEFYPTSIGVIGTVIDTVSKEEFTFRDLS